MSSSSIASSSSSALLSYSSSSSSFSSLSSFQISDRVDSKEIHVQPLVLSRGLARVTAEPFVTTQVHGWLELASVLLNPRSLTFSEVERKAWIERVTKEYQEYVFSQKCQDYCLTFQNESANRTLQEASMYPFDPRQPLQMNHFWILYCFLRDTNRSHSSLSLLVLHQYSQNSYHLQYFGTFRQFTQDPMMVLSYRSFLSSGSSSSSSSSSSSLSSSLFPVQMVLRKNTMSSSSSLLQPWFSNDELYVNHEIIVEDKKKEMKHTTLFFNSTPESKWNPILQGSDHKNEFSFPRDTTILMIPWITYPFGENADHTVSISMINHEDRITLFQPNTMITENTLNICTRMASIFLKDPKNNPQQWDGLVPFSEHHPTQPYWEDVKIDEKNQRFYNGYWTTKNVLQIINLGQGHYVLLVQRKEEQGEQIFMRRWMLDSMVRNETGQESIEFKTLQALYNPKSSFGFTSHVWFPLPPTAEEWDQKGSFARLHKKRGIGVQGPCSNICGVFSVLHLFLQMMDGPRSFSVATQMGFDEVKREEKDEKDRHYRIARFFPFFQTDVKPSVQQTYSNLLRLGMAFIIEGWTSHLDQLLLPEWSKFWIKTFINIAMYPDGWIRLLDPDEKWSNATEPQWYHFKPIVSPFRYGELFLRKEELKLPPPFSFLLKRERFPSRMVHPNASKSIPMDAYQPRFYPISLSSSSSSSASASSLSSFASLSNLSSSSSSSSSSESGSARSLPAYREFGLSSEREMEELFALQIRQEQIFKEAKEAKEKQEQEQNPKETKEPVRKRQRFGNRKKNVF